MPLDLTKPAVIKFYAESIEKEQKLRMKWNEVYGTDAAKAAKFRGDEKGHTEESIEKTILKIGLAALKRDFIASSRLRRTKIRPDAKPSPLVADMRKTHTIPALGLGDPKEDSRLARPDTDATPDPIQRPVPSELKQIIYTGTALAPLGRKEYLKERKKLKPEDRYYFPEQSSWEYGWRLKDSPFGRNAPSYSRAAVLTHQFNRVGPQPDPAHYVNTPTGKHFEL